MFDAIQHSAFKVCQSVFGYPATWTPFGGGATQNSQVIMKDPTKDRAFSDIEFALGDMVLEYYDTEMVGLKDSIDQGNFEAIVVTKPTGEVLNCGVKQVLRKFDGKTMVAIVTVQD